MLILLNKEHMQILGQRKREPQRSRLHGRGGCDLERVTLLVKSCPKPAVGCGIKWPHLQSEGEIRWSQGHSWHCDPVIPNHTMIAA